MASGSGKKEHRDGGGGAAAGGAGGGGGGLGAVKMGGEGSAFGEWGRGVLSGLGRPVSRLVTMTVGLEKLVATITNNIEDPGAGLYDDQGGFLVLPGGAVRAKPVILGERYRLVRLLGMGTFAQTVEAEDELSNHQPKQRVAIKIMRSGLQEIGRREAELLHFLRRCPGFASANIVTAHSLFAMGALPNPPALLPLTTLLTASTNQCFANDDRHPSDKHNRHNSHNRRNRNKQTNKQTPPACWPILPSSALPLCPLFHPLHISREHRPHSKSCFVEAATKRPPKP